jgi:hypothetical protein
LVSLSTDVILPVERKSLYLALHLMLPSFMILKLKLILDNTINIFDVTIEELMTIYIWFLYLNLSTGCMWREI